MAVDSRLGVPSSWYAVASSPDLASGDVRAARYFGRELVIFRTEAGEPAVLDAYCPHLGAHIGVGGRVDGNQIRCPFHNWAFDAGGTCTDVPYARRIPTNARVGTYPVQEKNGFVWAWFDPAERSPWYEVPELPQILDEDWIEATRLSWTIRTQIQEMGENGVDSAHFPAVHGASAVPEAEVTEDGARRRSIQRAPIRTSKGDAMSVIDVHNIGMGFGYTHFTGITETISMNLQTPIDENEVEFRVVFLQPRNGSNRGVAKAICLDLEKQVNEDIPIWENKIRHDRPLLCDGDGPIGQYRKWCSQFYTESTGASR